jgi:hypothetical protein
LRKVESAEKKAAMNAAEPSPSRTVPCQSAVLTASASVRPSATATNALRENRTCAAKMQATITTSTGFAGAIHAATCHS